jgi:hypothetical protein
VLQSNTVTFGSVYALKELLKLGRKLEKSNSGIMGRYWKLFINLAKNDFFYKLLLNYSIYLWIRLVALPECVCGTIINCNIRLFLFIVTRYYSVYFLYVYKHENIINYCVYCQNVFKRFLPPIVDINNMWWFFFLIFLLKNHNLRWKCGNIKGKTVAKGYGKWRLVEVSFFLVRWRTKCPNTTEIVLDSFKL